MSMGLMIQVKVLFIPNQSPSELNGCDRFKHGAKSLVLRETLAHKDHSMNRTTEVREGRERGRGQRND